MTTMGERRMESEPSPSRYGLDPPFPLLLRYYGGPPGVRPGRGHECRVRLVHSEVYGALDGVWGPRPRGEKTNTAEVGMDEWWRRRVDWVKLLVGLPPPPVGNGWWWWGGAVILQAHLPRPTPPARSWTTLGVVEEQPWGWWCGVHETLLQEAKGIPVRVESPAPPPLA